MEWINFHCSSLLLALQLSFPLDLDFSGWSLPPYGLGYGLQRPSSRRWSLENSAGTDFNFFPLCFDCKLSSATARFLLMFHVGAFWRGNSNSINIWTADPSLVSRRRHSLLTLQDCIACKWQATYNRHRISHHIHKLLLGCQQAPHCLYQTQQSSSYANCKQIWMACRNWNMLQIIPIRTWIVHITQSFWVYVIYK